MAQQSGFIGTSGCLGNSLPRLFHLNLLH